MMAFELGCLFFPAIVFSGLGFVLGVISLFVIRSSEGRLRGVGRARTAIFLSLVTLGAAFLVPFFSMRYEHRWGRWPARASEAMTMFGAFHKVESMQPPNEWFDGGGIEGTASGMRSGDGRVVANDSESVREAVKRVGFRDTAARHIAAVSIRHERVKDSKIQIVIWFAEVDTESDPGTVLAMKRGKPGEVTLRSGRFLMGVFSHQHPEGGELVERVAKFYSDEITRVERAREEEGD